jgi:tripartite ATP-independent transporter DctP family solute receptor
MTLWQKHRACDRCSSQVKNETREDQLKAANVFIALVLVAAALVTTRPVSAQQFNLRAAHYFKDDHPWNKGLLYFAKRVDEDSKGRIKIDIFNGGILGSEAQTLQFVKDGSLDLVISDPSAGAPFAKELDFFALPFLFRDYAHWQAALDGEPGKTYAQLIEAKTGLKIIGYWGGSSRNVLSTKKPVNSIEDLKGFRLRLISSPLKVNAWKAVGTVPTPIAFMETYLAMKSGVVDGMENESVAVREMKFYEPAPFIARTEHEFTVRPLFISKKTFDKLPPDLQQIVVKAALDATVIERKAELEANVAAEAEMRDKLGVKFNTIDKEPFKAATKPVIAEFAQKMELTDLLGSIDAIK